MVRKVSYVNPVYDNIPFQIGIIEGKGVVGVPAKPAICAAGARNRRLPLH